MKNEQTVEKLFKAIYGELISNEYNQLSDEEVVDIAYKTIKQFANRQGVELTN